MQSFSYMYDIRVYLDMKANNETFMIKNLEMKTKTEMGNSLPILHLRMSEYKERICTGSYEGMTYQYIAHPENANFSCHCKDPQVKG